MDRDDPFGWQRQLLPWTEDQATRYTNPDGDPRGDWASADATCNKNSEERPNLYYKIVNPKTGKSILPSKRRVWGLEREAFEKCIREGRVWWGPSGTNFPRLKKYRDESVEGVVPTTWWPREVAGDNQEARREIRAIFGENEIDFDTPKPTRLIERVLSVSCDKDGIVLDAFAGSGATGNAVLAMNRRDGGARRFILIESESYADKLTAERIRRVSKGVDGAADKQLAKGLGGSFSFFEIGKPIETAALLSGGDLPHYKDLASYVFYTATNRELDERKVDEKSFFVGETDTHEVFLLYRPDIDYLKNTALTLERARAFGKKNGKRRLVFAPAKYLDQDQLDEFQIDFAQLPFEIYRRAS